MATMETPEQNVKTVIDVVLVPLFRTYFTHRSDVFMANFEQVNNGWDNIILNSRSLHDGRA